MTIEEFKKVEGIPILAEKGGVFIPNITPEQVMAVFMDVAERLYKRPMSIEEVNELVPLVQRSVNGTEMLQVTSDQWKSNCTKLKNFLEERGYKINLRPIE